jgi:acetyl esterase/lipase
VKMITMRILTILLFTVLFFTGCKKADKNNDGSLSAKTVIDISYGPDTKQKMDVYLPANRSAATKVIFLIHGGGWTEGDKTDFNSFISTLQLRFPDYAFININYRLAANNQNLFPSQENDVKMAIEFVMTKKSEYMISDKWVFLGASAGAHLALLQSYKYLAPVKAKAVVSFFGPTDLVHLYNNSPNPLIPLLLFNVTGSTPSLNAAIYQQSSPINFVTAQSCPTILLQGGQDPLIPAIQATLLKAKLDSTGVANQYVFYPNDGHGWVGADLNDSFDKIEAFIKQYMN